jgi:nitroreductase
VKQGKDYYMADAAIAFEHLCLAARAMGLGTCWIGGFDEETVKGITDIPEGVRVVGITPLGYPDQEPNPRPRKSLAEIAFLEKWGHPISTPN